MENVPTIKMDRTHEHEVEELAGEKGEK